jgi:hypothetical protein
MIEVGTTIPPPTPTDLLGKRANAPPGVPGGALLAGAAQSPFCLRLRDQIRL